jgi:hypothetical protein
MGIFGKVDSDQYETTKPLSVGLGVRYKKVSAKMSLSVPYNGPSFDFELSSYLNRLYFEAYFKYYHNFYVRDTEERNELDMLSSGATMTFVQNYSNHSLSSVIKMDKKQNVSSGSFLYGFGLFYLSLDSKTEPLNNYEGRQRLIYTGPGIGYSYIWVFENGTFLNASFVLFLNAGINTSTGTWSAIPQWEPKIVFGQHHNTWSFNIKMANNTTFILWDTNNHNYINLISLSATFSKRF